MRNSIANGNGDSRYMKSAIPENITHEELVALLRDGTFPFDFNGINPAGFTQLGQALTKENLLDDNTEATIWGDIADRTVNQALLKLALSVYAGEGMVINVTVVNDTGEPFEGATVDGLFDSSANVMITDAEGKATGYTTSTSATLSISGFYDLEDATVTVTGDRGSTQDVTITVKRRNFLSITSTQAKMFSPFCKRVDVTSVGGGGAGGHGSAYRYNGYANPGGGGGGGYVTVKENVAFDSMVDYTAVVGAGGSPYSGATNTGVNPSGNAGGTSSFLGVSAAGGGGGAGVYQSSKTDGAAGGTGNGNGGNGAPSGDGTVLGGNGSAGTVYGYDSFTTTKLFGGGGGGGSCEVGKQVSSGGSPHGGAGGNGSYFYSETYSPTSPTTGTGFGGGGGGGGAARSSSEGSYSGRGAKGYQGCVNIRMWFGEDLSA